MKNLRYKGSSDVRRFDPESLKRIGIDESDELVWDKRAGGVLEVKNETADKLQETYKDDFEVVSDTEAEQLEAESDPTPTPLAGMTTNDESSSTQKSGKKS